MKARKEKIYPELKVGDKVKNSKKKGNNRKGAHEQTFYRANTQWKKFPNHLGQTYFKMTDYLEN